MNVEVSVPFEASYSSGDTGLVGIIQVAVVDNDGNVVIGPTVNDITEEIVSGTPIGVYTWNCPAAPAVLGQYSIVWSPDGTWNPLFVSTADELVVMAAGDTGVLPPIPGPVGGGLPFGPFTSWTTVDAVGACCEAEVGTDFAVFQASVDQASQVLFELSGRRFLGLGGKTARPNCYCTCNYCQVLSRGHLVGPWPISSDWSNDGCCENCCDPSRVLLSGYPVREIVQVKIDGVVLNFNEYGLYRQRWLVRRNGIWPHRQCIPLEDTEVGTWSVSYTFGQNPPLEGQAAATELACEFFKACTGLECSLPTGVSRITRQGVVIERAAFTGWGLKKSNTGEAGIWKTGLASVDAFLNAYNPTGMRRRPVVYSPASRLQFARPELT